MKKRGFGEGKWNGAGGKVKEGERIKQTAIREIGEEFGIRPTLLEKVAKINFFHPSIPTGGRWTAYVFLIKKWQGKPRESEEMKPQWFPFEKIPYDKMWPGDILWLPRILGGEMVTANIEFDENDRIVAQKITSVSKSPF